MQYGLTESYAEELPFIREVMFDVDDDTPRLVYADWLDDRGDRRGEFLRLDTLLSQSELGDAGSSQWRERRNRLIDQLDPQWVSLLARVPIELCPQKVEFRFMCPNRWQNLKPFGDDQAVRYCDQCGRSVTYCFTIAEARAKAGHGQCVALDPSVQRSPDDLTRMEDEIYETIGLIMLDDQT